MSTDDAVRLYRLGEDGGAVTLLYGSLAEAWALAAAQPEAVQAELFVQTAFDVIAWDELAGN